TALTDACSIGAYRTIDEDASLGIQQVVDIANKALSPGINDATTAATAIRHALGNPRPPLTTPH
ncbi:MAG: DUF2254 family protein, partial [bacterium]